MADKDEVGQLKEQMGSLEDQLKRAVADYRNLEKRIAEDNQAAGDFVKGRLVGRILPVLDSLDQAVEGASQSETQSSWLKGVLMSVKQLRQVLSDEGLAEIEVGDKFDPNLQEAVDVREGEDDKILEVVQQGYLLGGRVLRPAKVVVGKGQPVQMSEEAREKVETEEA